MRYRVTPVTRARRAAQRTYLDGVDGARREAGKSHRTWFEEHARRFKRTGRVVGTHGGRLYFVRLGTRDLMDRHQQLLGVAIIDTEDLRFLQRCLRTHCGGLGLETAFQHELPIVVTVRLNVMRELTEQTIKHVTFLVLIAGSLPRRQGRLVEAWAELHQQELMADWNTLQEGRTPEPIDPLK